MFFFTDIANYLQIEQTYLDYLLSKINKFSGGSCDWMYLDSLQKRVNNAIASTNKEYDISLNVNKIKNAFKNIGRDIYSTKIKKAYSSEVLIYESSGYYLILVGAVLKLSGARDASDAYNWLINKIKKS